jgi:hypothetical protein
MVDKSWLLGNDAIRGIILLLESGLGIWIILLLNKLVTKDLEDDE